MLELVRKATRAALEAEYAPRYMRTERGFHGRFYCALMSELDRNSLIPDGAILEMEYQKVYDVHGTTQRPDIILHKPREEAHAASDENNLVVWALKRQADEAKARADFSKLDEMLRRLRYQVAVFINIDTTETCRELYRGQFPERLLCFGVSLDVDGSVIVSD